MKRHDLTGQRFGYLVALEPTPGRYGHCIIWRCQCDCGNECEVPSYWLTSGGKRSCGCLQDKTRRRDITGEKRGHLTAVRPTEERQQGQTVWEWRCECGQLVYKTPGVIRKDVSWMCPDCKRAFKTEQGVNLNQKCLRDPKTGMLPGALDSIRKGKLYSNSSSGVRGVCRHKPTGKWVARIHHGGKQRTIGIYDTIEEAAEARHQAVLEIYGE